MERKLLFQAVGQQGADNLGKAQNLQFGGGVCCGKVAFQAAVHSAQNVASQSHRWSLDGRLFDI